MESLIELYRDICRIPSVKSGRIFCQGSFVKVETTWSQPDLTLNEQSLTVRQLGFYRSAQNPVLAILAHPPVPLDVQARVTSPSGSLTAILRKCCPGRKSGSLDPPQPSQFIEVWNNASGAKECTVDVKRADKHGVIHCDSIFGGLTWSHGEGHLCYLAERKPVAMSFFDPKYDPRDVDNPEKQAGVGDEFLFKSSWGEQLTKVVSPVPCIVDVPSGSISVLDNIPEFIVPSQCIWAPDDSGLIFAGLDGTERFGRIYCMNRKSTIYCYDLASASVAALSKSSGLAVDSPQLSPDQKWVVWLERSAGGPHAKASRLMKYDWTTKTMSLVVDIVGRPKEPSGFPGLFANTIPSRPWADDGKTMLITTIWESSLAITAINIETGDVTHLTKSRPGSWQYLDTQEGFVVAAYGEPNMSNQLMLGILKLPDSNSDLSVDWQRLGGSDDNILMPHLTTERFDWTIVKAAPVHETVEMDRLNYESIFCFPKSGSKWPLVVIPHGGPHSAHVTDLIAATTFLCNLGFAVLKVNYRGSLGFGEDNVNSLPGHVGDRDVKDVQHAVRQLIESDSRIDGSRVSVFGGSHGGFLALHLIGQYPEFYKAAIVRNPVVNIAAMLTETDIPDWCYSVAIGAEIDSKTVADTEVLKQMWNASPIRYVDQVVTPVLFLMGAVDLRCPHRHGLDYYRCLKARGQDVKMLWYPDNCHPIDKVDADADAMLNAARWLEEKLC